ncbi:hypothetical protein HYC85_022625 [Camellia sinensis]|uniref:Uncharacterized protein n=1 Tax=Camellia sinensis TaxID=4442 RepID=A0A7J7GG85_CAMSI|nr:hypothetical protein HYC85_022625 [Camellia sinensis]
MEGVGTSRQGTSSGNGDASIDMEGLVKSIREKLDELSSPSPECCIYKVSKNLKKINEKAYTPLRVSIGQLHHGKEGLEDMEEHKLRYFNDFVRRSGKSLEELVKIIEEMEKEICKCYAETINFKCDKFLEIILVDAAFIIEFLLRIWFHHLITPNDRIFRKPWMIYDINDDLLLLENQIPLSVLQYLFKMTNIQPKRNLTQPSATELHEAGVKFKVSSSKNLFAIKFSGNILEITHTQIVDPTERLLRNIIAYEQCHCHVKFFADYTVIMGYLINTSKDVELLVQAKIIENCLSDNNDVSNLSKGLNKEVAINRKAYYFTKLHKELNNYCEIRSHKWKATLRQDYCNTPWRVLSIIVAAILLGLTFIQSLCSLVSCNK